MLAAASGVDLHLVGPEVVKYRAFSLRKEYTITDAKLSRNYFFGMIK